MIAFLVNPAAGNGRGASVWSQAEHILRQRNVPYLVRFSQRGGKAAPLVGEILANPAVTAIVAVGGDGTVNDTVNGMYLAGRVCPFGHIPAGSCNDFARGRALPLDTREALERILSRSATRPVDVLEYGGRVAVNTIGVGMDGAVAAMTDQSSYKKWLNQVSLGMLAYLVSFFRVFFASQPFSATLTIDGTSVVCENVWAVSVTNIPNMAGILKVCPHAVPDDGCADVFVVSSSARWNLLPAFPLLLAGKHTRHPAVSFYRGKSITIETDRSLKAHTDGEMNAVAPMAVSVLSGWLPLIV